MRLGRVLKYHQVHSKIGNILPAVDDLDGSLMAR